MLDVGAFVRPLILGGVQPAGIPIDHQRDLGDVAVIDTKRLDPLATGPLGEMFEPFGEPAAEVADLIVGRARARTAGSLGIEAIRIVAGTAEVSSRGSFAVIRSRVAFLLCAKAPMLVELPPIPSLSIRGAGVSHGMWGMGGLLCLNFTPSDLHFQQSAGDRAVVQRHAIGRTQAELAGRRRVGSKNGCPPAAAVLHQPVAKPFEECCGPRQR